MIANNMCGHPGVAEAADDRKDSEEFNLRNSRVVVEYGPALIARIERAGSVEWGVLAEATVEALSEVTK